MITAKICINCGATFSCGATEPDNTCWCTALPNIVPMPDSGDCLCPDCLRATIKQIEAGKAANQAHLPQ